MLLVVGFILLAAIHSVESTVLGCELNRNSWRNKLWRTSLLSCLLSNYPQFMEFCPPKLLGPAFKGSMVLHKLFDG